MLDEARDLDVPAFPDPDDAPPSPIEFAAACGFANLDEWQAQVLTSNATDQILCCTRQSGKSTITGLKSLYHAAYTPGSLSLLLSPSQRQSGELHRKVMEFYKACELPLPRIFAESALRLELENGSRVIALPGSEATTRGYSAATLVVIDEASRVADALIAAVRPSLATTNGRMIALSTPFGKRGWFYEQWADGEGWERTRITAAECARITPEFLAKERRQLGEFIYMQEYECEFVDAESAVFSSELIARALCSDLQPLWEI